MGAVERLGNADGLDARRYIALEANGRDQLIGVHEFGVDVHEVRTDTFITVNDLNFAFTPNLNAVYLNGDEMWIGTETGAVRFEQEDNDDQQVVPKVTLEGLRVLYEPKSFAQDQEFEYEQNHVIFDFFGV